MKKMFIYVVEDIVSGSVVLGGCEYTDNRFALYAMRCLRDSNLKEYQIFKIAEYEDSVVTPVKREFIEWRVAAIQETQSTNLQLVGATENEKTVDFINKTK